MAYKKVYGYGIVRMSIVEARGSMYNSYVMNEALVIANFLLVLATIGLVFVTLIYASHTKKMAEVMLKDYELRVKPFIDAYVSEISSGPPGYDCRWWIRVKNIGDSKAYIKNAKSWSILLLLGTKVDFYQDNRLIELVSGDTHEYIVDAKFIDIGVATQGSTGTPHQIFFSFEYAGIDHDFKTWEMKLELP